MIGGFLTSNLTVSVPAKIGTFNVRLSEYEVTTGHYTLIIYYDSLMGITNTNLL